MLLIDGYEEIKEEKEDSGFQIYSGVFNRTSEKVRIFFYPVENEIVLSNLKIDKRFNLIKEIQDEHFVKLHDVLKIDDINNRGYAVIYQECSWPALCLYFSENRLDNVKFLKIAISLTKNLNLIHKAGLTENTISGSEIFFEPGSCSIKVRDYGFCNEIRYFFGKKKNNYYCSDKDLYYISPEKTGRLKTESDYRSDFYSLGIIFYEILTGSAPFTSDDPMKIIHAHIAMQPVYPSLKKLNIPFVFSSIIMKLLSKKPIDRYQSVFGLKYDLETCIRQIGSSNNINPFELGTKDVSQKFYIKEKLYGREEQTAILLNKLERTSNGHFESLLVSGYSGVGKSSLVSQLADHVQKAGGYFLKSKCSQISNNIPYFPVFFSFKELIKKILREDKTSIGIWKKRFLSVLGNLGQLIIDVIPNIEYIIGPQPSLPELPLLETQNRFLSVFESLISVFQDAKVPVVFFIDDLQWADSASLQMIMKILINPARQYFFLIGACRENEIDKSSTLKTFLNEASEKIGGFVVKLSPLKKEDINNIVKDIVSSNLEFVSSVSDIIFERTKGNPFLIKQLLKTWCDEKLIAFSFETGVWQWDMEKLKLNSIADNIIDTMSNKMLNLSEKIQDILKIAACLGDKFDFKTLAILYEGNILELSFNIQKIIEEGFFVTSSESLHSLKEIGIAYMQCRESDDMSFFKSLEEKMTFSFFHDRIRQAVYLSVSSSNRKFLHFEIGNKLLQTLSEDDFKEKIFTVVTQLNFGQKLLLERKEKKNLAGLNLVCGKKAKRMGSYEVARQYLLNGLSLIEDEAWERQYSFYLEFYTELCEICYCANDINTAEKAFSKVINNSNISMDKIRIYELKITHLSTLYKKKEAIVLGKQALLSIGVKLPVKISAYIFFKEYSLVKLSLKNKKFEDLMHHKELSDPKILARAKLLMSILEPCYIHDPDYTVIIIFRLVRLAVKYGNSKYAPFSYVAYASFLCGVIKDIYNGYKMGTLALGMSKQIDTGEMEPNIKILFGSMINHCKNHMSGNLVYFMDAYKDNVQYGGQIMASFALNLHIINMLFSALTLFEVISSCSKNLPKIEALNQPATTKTYKLWYQMVLNFKGEADDWRVIKGVVADENKITPEWYDAKEITFLAFFFLGKMVLFCLYGDFQEALKLGEKGLLYVKGIKNMVFGHIYMFFYSLSLLACIPYISGAKKIKYLKIVKKNQKQMKNLVKYSPENFLNKFTLIEAELSTFKKNIKKTIGLYKKAILSAKKSGFKMEEAISNERLANFLFLCGLDEPACLYIQKARDLYKLWGSELKVVQIEKSFPAYFEKVKKNEPSVYVNQMDYLAIVDYLKVISMEIVLEALLEKLLTIMVENAGANKGIIMLVKNGSLSVEAELMLGEDKSVIVKSIPLKKRNDLIITVINYVRSIKKHVVIDDVKKEGWFMTDPYAMYRSSGSILCIPIIRQTEIIGILYLENSISTGVFTSDRIETLMLLASHAAICLENAMLYDNIKHAEYALRESEKKYRLLAENVSDVIWIVNLQDFKITYIGQSVVSLLDYTPEEIISFDLEYIFTRNSFTLLLKFLTEELIIAGKSTNTDTKPIMIELEFIKKDKTIVITEVIFSFLRDNNQFPISAVGVARDITIRKKAEEEVKRLNADLEQRVKNRTKMLEQSLKELKMAQDQLVQSEKMAALGQLVAGVAHEINTPVGVSVTAASFLDEKTKEIGKIYNSDTLKRSDLENYIKTACETSEIILKNLRRSANLIQSFKQVSVDQSSKEKRVFNLNENIKDLLLSLKPNLKRKKHIIDIICPDTIYVDGYPGVFFQIFTNLVVNSLIHGVDEMEEFNLKIDISADSFLNITYCDNGKGMDKDTQKKMFDPFFTTKRVKGSTGLGLHIVYNLVTQSLGGTITCDSSPGKGACFFIKIPVINNKNVKLVSGEKLYL